MTILVLGHRGVLGSAVMKHPAAAEWGARLENPYYQSLQLVDAAILCAGTKGFAENEGNRGSFKADVDGNIGIIRHLLRHNVFVVFVSTDAVEWGAHTAYARNRLLVEQAIWLQPNTAVVRPAKFDASNVGPLAELCVRVAIGREEGLHCWKH